MGGDVWMDARVVRDSFLQQCNYTADYTGTVPVLNVKVKSSNNFTNVKIRGKSKKCVEAEVPFTCFCIHQITCRPLRTVLQHMYDNNP